jgi:hypothetical protein
MAREGCTYFLKYARASSCQRPVVFVSRARAGLFRGLQQALEERPRPFSITIVLNAGTDVAGLCRAALYKAFHFCVGIP